MRGTKKRMIDATVTIISEEGLHQLTNRRIAQKAGVNVAAISYHFGSQQGLINEALRAMTDELRDAYLRLRNTDAPAAQRLETFIRDFTDVASRHPVVVRNPVDLMLHEAPFETYSDWMQYIESEGITIIKSAFMELRPGYDDVEAHLAALNLLGCLAFPYLVGTRLSGIWKVDLDDLAVRERLVESIVKLFVTV